MKTAQYAPYVSDRIAYARQLVRKSMPATALSTLDEFERAAEPRAAIVVGLLRCNAPQGTTVLNEYYGKHGELPALDLTCAIADGATQWSIEDDTGMVAVDIRAPDRDLWHLADGVAVLAHLCGGVGDVRADRLVWMSQVYGATAHTSSVAEPMRTVVYAAPFAPDECREEEAEVVVIGSGDGAPSRGAVTHAPNDATGALVPLTPLRMCPDRAHRHVSSPSVFAVHGGAQRWMVLPTSLIRAWRQWLPPARHALRDIVHAILVHRHVVPMAPRFFPVPMMARDAFFIDLPPDVVVAVVDDAAAPSSARVVVPGAHTGVHCIEVPPGTSGFVFCE